MDLEFKLKRKISLRSKIFNYCPQISLLVSLGEIGNYLWILLGKFYTKKDSYKMKKQTEDSNVNIRIKLSAHWRA